MKIVLSLSHGERATTLGFSERKALAEWVRGCGGKFSSTVPPHPASARLARRGARQAFAALSPWERGKKEEEA